jgi:hypothetical protein
MRKAAKPRRDKVAHIGEEDKPTKPEKEKAVKERVVVREAIAAAKKRARKEESEK